MGQWLGEHTARAVNPGLVPTGQLPSISNSLSMGSNVLFCVSNMQSIKTEKIYLSRYIL